MLNSPSSPSNDRFTTVGGFHYGPIHILSSTTFAHCTEQATFTVPVVSITMKSVDTCVIAPGTSFKYAYELQAGWSHSYRVVLCKIPIRVPFHRACKCDPRYSSSFPATPLLGQCHIASRHLLHGSQCLLALMAHPLTLCL